MAADGKDEEQVEIKEGKTGDAQTSASVTHTRARASESNMRSAQDLDERDKAISARRRTGGPEPAEVADEADPDSTPENDSSETDPAE